MAFQLIYTSASAALKPGVTGFATVAQHRGIRAAIVRAIEQRSGYLDSAAHGGKRPAVFAFRRIEVAGERAYVLSRVVASGADYTGRNNHLAHHLVVTDAELENLRLSPADVMLQMKWEDRWDKEPQYFSEVEEIKLSTMKPCLSLPARKWTSWPKDSLWDPACAAIPFNTNESKDARSFFAVGDVADTGRLIELYGESLLLKDPDCTRPAMMWQTPFTTLEIQAEDAQEFQWIGCVHGSPRHNELLKQKRGIIDLTVPSLTPPAGELAETARSPARGKARAPDIEKEGGTTSHKAERPEVPLPSVKADKTGRGGKKRDYEKEMLARIEGADLEEKSLRERLMPLVIGVAVIFLGLVAWQVYQEVSTNKKKAQERAVRSSVQGTLQQLEQSFKQGNDVSTQAHDLRDKNTGFATLPEKDPLRTQLDELIQRHEAWFALRSEVQEYLKQQALLNPVDKEKLDQLKAGLVALPEAIHGDLGKELDTLIAEQMSIKTILAAKEKGVNPRDAAKKIELAGTANNQFARAEVREGLLKIVVALFPPPPPPPPKTKPENMVAAKTESAPPPKVKDIVTDSNPGIALLQRMPETHVVPRSELRVSYAAIGAVKQAVGVLTADDAPGSPSVSVAEAGSGAEPAAGILNALGGAKFTTYQIAGTNVYAQGSQLVMNFSPGSALDFKSGAALPWKPDTRYLFSFSQSKPDATGAPPQRFPDLHLLSLPPAPSKEEALKLPPLLLLPAADFLAREGTRIVIKSGSSPDLRKLLGKLILAAGTEAGASFAYEFSAPAAPALKRSNGTLPTLAHSSDKTATDTLWSSAGIDLSLEVQRPAQRRHDEIQQRLKFLSPLVTGIGILSASVPADFAGLTTEVTTIRPPGKGERRWQHEPIVAENDLPVRFLPGRLLTPAVRSNSTESAMVTHLDMLKRVVFMLKKERIHLTKEDEKILSVLAIYATQPSWIGSDAWPNSLAAYTALLSDRPPTDDDKKGTETKPPEYGEHQWANRKALFGWFKQILSPEMMEKAKDYLLWVPGTSGVDPVAMRKQAEAELQIWSQDAMVADLLEKAPPEKLSERYTLLVSFPFTFPNTQQPAKAFLKWVEFTGQPEAAPKIPGHFNDNTQNPNNKP